jgi:hypothetical protein
MKTTLHNQGPKFFWIINVKEEINLELFLQLFYKLRKKFLNLAQEEAEKQLKPKPF